MEPLSKAAKAKFNALNKEAQAAEKQGDVIHALRCYEGAQATIGRLPHEIILTAHAAFIIESVSIVDGPENVRFWRERMEGNS